MASLILCLGASIICARSRSALETDNAVSASRLVTQVAEKAVLSDQIVEEVDDVVQVFNQLANVAKATVVVSAASRTTTKPVTPTGAIAGRAAAIYRST